MLLLSSGSSGHCLWGKSICYLSAQKLLPKLMSGEIRVKDAEQMVVEVP
jgi:hypothetical protein